MTSNISIILVAGAWHNDFHIQPLVSYIEKYGHRLMPITLETSKNTPATTSDNFGPICKAIQDETSAGRKVCVVGHSVAGISIVGGIAQFLDVAEPTQKRNLVAVIFLATFVMNLARSLSESTWFRLDDKSDPPNFLVSDDPAQVFYGDLAPEAAKPFADALTKNWASPAPDELHEWWQRIKAEVGNTEYFVCLRDKAVPAKFQHIEAEDMGARVTELDTDHCPMVGQPAVLAEAIHKVVSQ